LEEPRRVLGSIIENLIEPKESGRIGRCCVEGGLLFDVR